MPGPWRAALRLGPLVLDFSAHLRLLYQGVREHVAAEVVGEGWRGAGGGTGTACPRLGRRRQPRLARPRRHRAVLHREPLDEEERAAADERPNACLGRRDH